MGREGGRSVGVDLSVFQRLYFRCALSVPTGRVEGFHTGTFHRKCKGIFYEHVVSHALPPTGLPNPFIANSHGRPQSFAAAVKIFVDLLENKGMFRQPNALIRSN